MAISLSTDKTDNRQKEILEYGTIDFPIAFFDDDLTIVKVPWHWHEELEIIYILDGEVAINIAGDEFVLQKGEGYFINRSVLHSTKLLSNKGWQHAMVFSPDIIARKGDIIYNSYLKPLFDGQTISYIKLVGSVPWQRKILELAEQAWQSGAYERKDYPLTVRNNLSQCVALILENIKRDKFSTSTLSEKEDTRIKDALNYIEANYKEQITINDIAKCANISVSTLLKLFHEVMHTTPIKFLIDYRLDKIYDELLYNQSKPINEIAFCNGFNDPSYFNRCFKAKYGMTPSEYRNFTFTRIRET